MRERADEHGPDFIEPDDDLPEDHERLAAAADEQFVHGLLDFLREDDAERQRARIERLMSAVDPAVETTPETPVLAASDDDPAPRSRRRRIDWPVLVSIAASVLVVLGVVLVLRRGDAVGGLVDDALAASRALDRRYAVEVQLQHHPVASLHGEQDLHGDGHVVTSLHTPHGGKVAAGRDADGAWVVHSHVPHQRLDVDEAWPRWVVLGRSTACLESVDELLRELHDAYRIERHGTVRLHPPHAQTAEPSCHHVVAELELDEGHHPERVDLWIDTETHVVRRVELHWPEVDSPSSPLEEFHVIHDVLMHGPGHVSAPRFLREPPDFEAGTHAPPRRVRFELVGHPSFDADWFAPQAHEDHED